MNSNFSLLIKILIYFWRFLEQVGRIITRLGPSQAFNIMKMPQLLAVLLRVVESPFGAMLFLALWAILAFWVPRYGRVFFWISIGLQLLFIGFPEFLLASGKGTQSPLASLPIVLQFSETWPLWIFAAGIILEIIDWCKSMGSGGPH